MTNPICPYCKFPVPIKGALVRHFGTHVAHTEDECFRLLHAEIARLRTENERLQRDVLRYRWLREFVTRPDDVAMMFDELGFSGDATPEGFDRAVDAAMAGEPNASNQPAP